MTRYSGCRHIRRQAISYKAPPCSAGVYGAMSAQPAIGKERTHNMMIYRSIFFAAVCLFTPAIASSQHLGCRAADAATAKVLYYVKGVASLNKPARDSMGLAGVDTALVVSETDSVTCISVAQVVDSVLQKPTPVLPYVVVRAGNRYAAYQPSNDPNKPSQLLHILDSMFIYRRTVTGF